jgi:hypothetical protein
MSTPWKNIEPHAVKLLGGTRNSRGGDFGKSASDVEHPRFSVECKYRKILPRLLRLGLEQATRYDYSKPVLLVLKERYQKGALVVMRLIDLTGSLKSTEKGQL